MRSLFNYLNEHPQIYMSPFKEPRFFGFVGETLNYQGPGDDKVNFTLVTDLKEYQALFANVSGQKAIGEASTWYLYMPEAAEQIQQHIPHAKLIAVLRNPADRAFSNYLHQRNRSSEEPLADFAEALAMEEERIQKNWRPFWHYRNMGFYAAQLRRYYDRFPRKQIRIYLQEDLKKDTSAVVRDIFQFLEVDDTFNPDTSKQFYKAYEPKNRVLHAFVMRKNPIKALVKTLLPASIGKQLATKVRTVNRQMNSAPLEAKLAPEIRKQLIEVYREDILQLQEMIQRDLSAWLTW